MDYAPVVVKIYTTNATIALFKVISFKSSLFSFSYKYAKFVILKLYCTCFNKNYSKLCYLTAGLCYFYSTFTGISLADNISNGFCYSTLSKTSNVAFELLIFFKYYASKVRSLFLKP